MFINNSLNKGISMPIAILVIIVAAVIGGGLVLWQYSEMEKETANIPETEDTKIDTSDWETYSNKEYGFEMKYPSEWYVYESETTKIMVLSTFPKSTTGIPEDYGVAYFNYRDDISIERIFEIKKNWLEMVTGGEIEGLQLENSSVEDIEIDNISGYRVYVSGKDLRGLRDKEEIREIGIDYYLPYKNKESFFQIEGKFEGENREKYAKHFDQMLSTFKFIE